MELIGLRIGSTTLNLTPVGTRFWNKALHYRCRCHGALPGKSTMRLVLADQYHPERLDTVK